jgi:hypothetical protein
MKKLILLLSLCLTFIVWADDRTATTVANEWLKIVDAGNYSESWQKSDSFFQSQLSEQKWSGALKSVRTPLGDVNSRTKVAAKEYTSLPGVPDGMYTVIQFETNFENKESATETLTLSKSSGAWLPVGYFIN